MVGPSKRRAIIERENREGGQEASSRLETNQPPNYVTRNEMEAMIGTMQEQMMQMQEQMMRRQEEMTQNFLRQLEQAGAAGAVRVPNQGVGEAENLTQRDEAQNPGNGGRQPGANPNPKAREQLNIDRNSRVRPEEYIPEFPRGAQGQAGNDNWRQPFGDNDRIAEAIRQAMRGGLVNRDIENVSRSPFTPNIRYARNPPDFKLPTLGAYEGKTDPTVHLMKYIRHMEVMGVSEEVMARCFPLYLEGIAALWFRQLDNGFIGTWTELVDRFMKQFRIHIARPKSVMTLTTMKQRTGESLRNFLTRFNAAVASVDRPDPSMVLIAAVSGIATNTNFKITLDRDPPRDLGEFYHEAERFLRQEDAKADREGVNAIMNEGPSGGGSNTDKGKRKAIDSPDGVKQQRRGPRFASYTGLTETPARIYLDTRGHIPYQRPTRREPTDRERKSERYCIFHELNGHDTNSCSHLKDVIEEHVRNGRLQQYVRLRIAMEEPQRPPTTSNRTGNGPGARVVE